ncbi:uncharacterized protein LOC115219957 [Octopus sinensis]|uniref:Uncharacterized protein LOC115219957 n=1 Tax=Octopus sinensis TaxID=2607531 RepID=A0A6P7T5H7_9MOLL|nr:uncharacterized protein LOC115219957 [Octopus sinensis]
MVTDSTENITREICTQGVGIQEACTQESNYWAFMIEYPLMQQSSHTGAWVRLFELSVVLTFGLIGNILVFIVMQRPALRKQSFSRYLSLLAICDSLSLIIRALFWINLLSTILKSEIIITFRTDFLCGFSEYFMTANHVICSWLLVCITCERIIVTAFPFSAAQFCTPKIANTVLVALVMSVCIGLSYVFYFSQFACNVCGMARQAQNVHYTIATTCVTVAPLVIIIISNIGIIFALRCQSDIVSHRQQLNNRNRITKMLLVLSISFVILFLPNAMLVLLMQLRPDWQTSLSVALGPVNMLWDINYGINFYLYAITGKVVRKEVKTVFRWMKVKFPTNRRSSRLPSISSGGVSTGMAASQTLSSIYRAVQ